MSRYRSESDTLTQFTIANAIAKSIEEHKAWERWVDTLPPSLAQAEREKRAAYNRSVINSFDPGD